MSCFFSWVFFVCVAGVGFGGGGRVCVASHSLLVIDTYDLVS